MTDPTRAEAGRSALLPAHHAAGLRIGLFGGSFNPPHEGHRLASLIALHRLKLDRIWWLVTPGNPLKDHRDLPRLDERIEAARRIADHPSIDVTGIEAALGTRYTVDLLLTLKRRCPGVRFVWIMGADNLQTFHRWHRWTTIVEAMPIAVIDRPGATIRGLHGRASTYLSRWRVPEHDAGILPLVAAPAFAFLHGPRSRQSSTALRKRIILDGKDDRPKS